MLSHVPTRLPLNNPWIRSGYGTWLHDRGRIDGYRHAGIDLYSHDTRVFSPVVGTITLAIPERAGWTGYGPYIVEIRDQQGYHHLIAHLSNIDGSIRSGTHVYPGSRIGSIKPNGHIHYEIRTGLIRAANPWQHTIDPLDFHNIDKAERFPYHINHITNRGVRQMRLGPHLDSIAQQVATRVRGESEQDKTMVTVAWIAGIALLGWVILK